MSIAPDVRRYQLYLKMKDKKLLPMNRQLIPLQSSCVRKCRRQHHLLPHRQHLLRLQRRRRHLLLHRQNRQKPEVLPVFPTENRPSGSQAGNQNTAEEPKTTPKPTPKVTPTPRPQVIEATPEPTPVPEVQNISLDTYSIDILPGDSWRINIAAAPSDFYSMGAQWVCSNSAVVSLSGSDTSGVTITAVSTGSATVTVYSRSTGQSASCTVNVN